MSACPHRQFHTLPGLLDSWATLSNSYPIACVPMQWGSVYHFYDGLCYDPTGTRTHDLPCERRTRLPLSQPDTVPSIRPTSWILAQHCCVTVYICHHKTGHGSIDTTYWLDTSTTPPQQLSTVHVFYEARKIILACYRPHGGGSQDLANQH